ncbi:MAG: hypothetical protein WAK78_20780 [Candidatus Acidiferrales bacterium]
MNRFRRSRDDGTFALTTLQNPSLESRSLSQLIAAPKKNVAEEAVAGASSPHDAPPSAAVQPSPEPQPPQPKRGLNPFPLRMDVRETRSGEIEFRYVCGEYPPPAFAPIRDPAQRARIAKYLAEQQAATRDSLAAPESSTLSSGSAGSSDISEPESFTPTIPYAYNSISPDFSRHSRRCSVCAHPDRDAIEADFVRWRGPETIAKNYKIVDRGSIYRHAHATGLFARRKRESCRILENILECVETCPPSMLETIIRATRAYAHMDDQGRWFEPPRTQYVIYGPPPTDEAVTDSRNDAATLKPQNAIAAQPVPRTRRNPRKILTATRPSSKKARTP